MKRVHAAINEGRCVVAVGGRALGNDLVLAELRRRSLKPVALGAGPVGPAIALNADNIAPALSKQGGILVLVEPDGASDGRALSELAKLIKAGEHRPKLYVAAKAFNPFGLPMEMRLMKMEQLKLRAVDFLSQLPMDVPTHEAADSKKEKRKKEAAQYQAPRPTFVGREEESASLLEMLAGEGGPIVLTGALGIGRRWLVEHCLAQTELKRVPDFCFGRGTNVDAFAGMLAILCKEAGDDSLHDVIRQARKRPPARQLAELVVSALQSESLANHVWVIDGLDSLLDRRDGSLYSDDALAALVRGILLSKLALKVVFISTMVPMFYKEGQTEHLQVLRLEGLKGKELHDLFQAWQIPEFPRDRFGPIVERTFGHPMASRYLGVAIREEGDVDALLKQPKFLKAKEATDAEPLQRHIKRRVGELDEGLRLALSATSLFRTPVSAQVLQLVGIKRVQRLMLLSQGLLEQTPLQDERRYYVHPLVQKHLNPREVLDFEKMKDLATAYMDESKSLKSKGDLTGSIALAFEANRWLSMSRNGRSRLMLPYPDNDATIENIREILRWKNPRFDIARMRLKEAQKVDPRNPKLFQLEVELSTQEGKKDFDAASMWNRAIEECAVPDLFHHQATIAIRKNARGKAVAALEAGVQLFADNARLRRRLASLQISQNRLEDARDTLKMAQEIEPMMPDAYSQLAEVYMRMGTEHLEDATASLEEAMRLDPEGSQHHARQGELHRIHAMLQPDQRDDLLQKAEDSYREALRIEPNHSRNQVGLATILLDKPAGDIEQAEWLLSKAGKRNESANSLIQKARLLIRKETLEEVERLLDRATKKEPSNHAAFAARAEFWMAQGQIFRAFEAMKTARERSPKGCPERNLYETQMQQLGVLIESGQAAELLKVQESEPGNAVSSDAEPTGVRRDPGTTTRLRKAKSDAEADDEDSSSVEEGAVSDAAESAPAADDSVAETAEAEEAEDAEAEDAEAEAEDAESEEADAEAPE